MKKSTPLGSPAFAIISLALSAHLSAATFPDATLKAWDSYLIRAEAQLSADSCDPNHSLLIDKQPENFRRVSSGEIDSIPGAQGGMVSIPSGLIHHWLGTIFFPNVDKSQLLGILQDYGQYSEIYRPAVIQSKLINHKEDEFTYELKLVELGFGLKSGLVGNFQARYYETGPNTGYSLTEATSLVEADDIGTSHEKLLSPVSSPGYVKRAVTIVRYRQTNGGIYLEVETLTLSRDIPPALKWVVSPLVKRFSRQVMTETLERLRNRVNQLNSLQAAFNK